MIEQKYSGFAKHTSTMVQATLSKVKLWTGGKLLQQNNFDYAAEKLCGSDFAIFP
jgi:hypothetical protein